MEVNRKTKPEFRLLFLGLGILLVTLVAIAIRNYVKSARGREMLATAQDETAIACSRWRRGAPPGPERRSLRPKACRPRQTGAGAPARPRPA